MWRSMGMDIGMDDRIIALPSDVDLLVISCLGAEGPERNIARDVQRTQKS